MFMPSMHRFVPLLHALAPSFPDPVPVHRGVCGYASRHPKQDDGICNAESMVCDVDVQVLPRVPQHSACAVAQGMDSMRSFGAVPPCILRRGTGSSAPTASGSLGSSTVFDLSDKYYKFHALDLF